MTYPSDQQLLAEITQLTEVVQGIHQRFQAQLAEAEALNQATQALQPTVETLANLEATIHNLGGAPALQQLVEQLPQSQALLAQLSHQQSELPPLLRAAEHVHQQVQDTVATALPALQTQVDLLVEAACQTVTTTVTEATHQLHEAYQHHSQTLATHTDAWITEMATQVDITRQHSATVSQHLDAMNTMGAAITTALTETGGMTTLAAIQEENRQSREILASLQAERHLLASERLEWQQAQQQLLTLQSQMRSEQERWQHLHQEAQVARFSIEQTLQQTHEYTTAAHAVSTDLHTVQVSTQAILDRLTQQQQDLEQQTQALQSLESQATTTLNTALADHLQQLHLAGATTLAEVTEQLQSQRDPLHHDLTVRLQQEAAQLTTQLYETVPVEIHAQIQALLATALTTALEHIQAQTIQDQQYLHDRAVLLSTQLQETLPAEIQTQTQALVQALQEVYQTDLQTHRHQIDTLIQEFQAQLTQLVQDFAGQRDHQVQLVQATIQDALSQFQDSAQASRDQVLSISQTFQDQTSNLGQDIQQVLDQESQRLQGTITASLDTLTTQAHRFSEQLEHNAHQLEASLATALQTFVQTLMDTERQEFLTLYTDFQQRLLSLEPAAESSSIPSLEDLVQSLHPWQQELTEGVQQALHHLTTLTQVTQSQEGEIQTALAELALTRAQTQESLTAIQERILPHLEHLDSVIPPLETRVQKIVDVIVKLARQRPSRT